MVPCTADAHPVTTRRRVYRAPRSASASAPSHRGSPSPAFPSPNPYHAPHAIHRRPSPAPRAPSRAHQHAARATLSSLRGTLCPASESGGAMLCQHAIWRRRLAEHTARGLHCVLHACARPTALSWSPFLRPVRSVARVRSEGVRIRSSKSWVECAADAVRARASLLTLGKNSRKPITFLSYIYKSLLVNMWAAGAPHPPLATSSRLADAKPFCLLSGYTL